jgi:hypothetical protein
MRKQLENFTMQSNGKAFEILELATIFQSQDKFKVREGCRGVGD